MHMGTPTKSDAANPSVAIIWAPPLQRGKDTACRVRLKTSDDQAVTCDPMSRSGRVGARFVRVYLSESNDLGLPTVSGTARSRAFCGVTRACAGTRGVRTLRVWSLTVPLTT